MTFHRALQILGRQWFIALSVLLVCIAIAYGCRGRFVNTYAGVAHVLLVSESGARDTTVSIVDLPSIATSSVVLERVKNALGLATPLVDLEKHVTARVVQRSSIMEISYRDASPDIAMQVTNAVADETARFYGEVSARRYDSSVASLTTALDAQRARLDGINDRMRAAQARDAFVITEKSTDDVTERADELELQRSVAAADLSGSLAMAATTAPSSETSRIARHEILAGDPSYTAMRWNVAHDAAHLAADRAGYTDRFPGLAGESAKVESEQSAVWTEASRALHDPNAFSPSAAGTIAQHARQLAIVQADRERLTELNQLIAEQRQRLLDIPRDGADYAALRADRDAAASELATLAARRGTAVANGAEATSLGSLEVLDRAVKADTEPSGQRSLVAFVIGLLAICFAIGAAFLADALDPRLRRADQIESLYGRPVIANLAR